MNVQAKYPTTPDEFLRWNEGREGKREFVRGRVVEMMINTTIRHAVLSMRLGSILLREFPYPSFFVGSADVAVRTPDGIRYPDIFVDRGSPTRNEMELVAAEPVSLAEILSPSSLARDFVDKVADYSAISSLRFYLIAAQEEPRVWLWSRDSEGMWRGPAEFAGHDETITLDGFGAVIPLAELYGGIERR